VRVSGQKFVVAEESLDFLLDGEGIGYRHFREKRNFEGLPGLVIHGTDLYCIDRRIGLRIAVRLMALDFLLKLALYFLSLGHWVGLLSWLQVT